MNANGDSSGSHPSTRVGAALGALALAALLAACTTTQAAKPELTKGRCAYLAPDVCSKLTPSTSDQEPALRYVAPNVQWSQYTKVMVSPVTVWGGAKRKISNDIDRAS